MSSVGGHQATRGGIALAEKPAHLLGKVLDEMAARRGVRGPYNVADHVRQETGEGPGGSAWSQIFSGSTYRPRREVIITFAKAFKLSPEELHRLAHVFTFDKEPPAGMEVGSEYADLAEQFGWAGPQGEGPGPAAGAPSEPADPEKRARVEDFMRQRGFEEKEALAYYHLTEAERIFRELEMAKGSSPHAAMAFATFWFPHFLALRNQMGRWVLNRDYPEGWGSASGPAEEEEQPG